MTIAKTEIYVYAHWVGMPKPLLMGTLTAQHTKGRKSFSFTYSKQWLSRKETLLLDPEIGLFAGPQFPKTGSNFGVFSDAMPDTWGRTLMKRRAAQLAKAEGSPAPMLHEIDFLLGVSDTCRMGALRFKTDPEGPFLNDDNNLPVPPWTSIGELQFVAGLAESDEDSTELRKWLGMLMAPGSSLGGARPKANVADKNGNLWIAKFPSKNDTIYKAKWEFLAYKLATAAGINMSESKIEKVAGQYHTFFTKRFDRNMHNRVHFASAMTMTGNHEEQLRDNRASYLDIALFIQNHCSDVNKNLAELWRRIVFNIAISNSDDHLRNHGFIAVNGSWQLSPAFDINPSVDKDELSLNIDDNSGELNFDIALGVAEYFRLEPDDAIQILSEVTQAVSPWEKIAKQIGINRSEIELMQAAFRF